MKDKNKQLFLKFGCLFYLTWTYLDHKKFEILLILSNIRNTQYIIKDFIMSSVNKVNELISGLAQIFSIRGNVRPDKTCFYFP